MRKGNLLIGRKKKRKSCLCTLEKLNLRSEKDFPKRRTARQENFGQRRPRGRGRAAIRKARRVPFGGRSWSSPEKKGGQPFEGRGGKEHEDRQKRRWWSSEYHNIEERLAKERGKDIDRREGGRGKLEELFYIGKNLFATLGRKKGKYFGGGKGETRANQTPEDGELLLSKKKKQRKNNCERIEGGKSLQGEKNAPGRKGSIGGKGGGVSLLYSQTRL